MVVELPRFISITAVTAARGCHYTYALGGRSRVAVESCDHLEVETAYCAPSDNCPPDWQGDMSWVTKVLETEGPSGQWSETAMMEG